MEPFLSSRFGNPSEPHRMGREARAAIEGARRTMAELLGCRPEQIVYTSGGTEADNQAVFGLCGRPLGRLVCSVIEHPAVRGAGRGARAPGLRGRVGSGRRERRDRSCARSPSWCARTTASPARCGPTTSPAWCSRSPSSLRSRRHAGRAAARRRRPGRCVDPDLLRRLGRRDDGALGPQGAGPEGRRRADRTRPGAAAAADLGRRPGGRPPVGHRERARHRRIRRRAGGVARAPGRPPAAARSPRGRGGGGARGVRGRPAAARPRPAADRRAARRPGRARPRRGGLRGLGRVGLLGGLDASPAPRWSRRG